ncbi:MAG: GNAT family N-acetyltransferase [Acidobacteria bacterium]|nr:GNAT family N-acetyltransferase [Acidobacteriota bacterium]
MYTSTSLAKVNSATRPPSAAQGPALTAQALANEHREEVLQFLSSRPVHTVVMAGFIRDNGLVSPLNRGTFYGCRGEGGQLEGVALIGHATLVETQSDKALAAFARIARDCPRTHVMMGEQENIERFWAYYAEGGRSPRMVCSELLMEQRWPVEVRGEAVPGLRLATPDDLQQVMVVQGQMAFEECGVNPMETDPEGFRRRCARRIEQGRVWVWIEGDRLIFKADIISDTPDVIYVEGVWVAPEERGQGYGSRCLSQLSRDLLSRAGAITLLVNKKNPEAAAFYRRAGYKAASHYDTIYLNTAH